MRLIHFLLPAVFVIAPLPAMAQCVDFDGDGRVDSCGSVGNIPMPSAPQRVESYSSGQADRGSRQQQAPAPRKAHHSSVPSMQSMVATTIFGSLLEAALMGPPPPTGPTPEEIEAQRKLEEHKRLEFQRKNRDLTRRLKGSYSAVEDKNVVEAGGLKLKKIATTPASSSGDVFTRFFGSEGPVPTVQLLREEGSLIATRLGEPNKWAGSIAQTLKTNAPPLPYKKFNELQPGDVLLVKGSGASKLITKGDNLLSGGNTSSASHTVIYLREVNGVKHFLENTPGKGPRIIFEDEVLREYGSRGADVAKLAQPLNDREAKNLYAAAVDMSAKNRTSIKGGTLLGTNYGAWGRDNVVCSEADWALLNLARPDHQIAPTSDNVKAALGIDFSPADFYKNGQHFLVSPLDMSSK